MSDTPPVVSVPEPDDLTELRAAIDKACPDGAVLLRINADHSVTQLVSPKPLSGQSLFGLFVAMAQRIGEGLGLRLGWLPQEPPSRILAPRGIRGLRAPGG